MRASSEFWILQQIDSKWPKSCSISLRIVFMLLLHNVTRMWPLLTYGETWIVHMSLEAKVLKRMTSRAWLESNLRVLL